MFKLALKSLLGHKVRMLLTALSIIIGVSFVTGTYVFTDTMSATFDQIFERAYGEVDVVVRPSEEQFELDFGGDYSSETATLDESITDTISAVDGVKAVDGDVSGIAQLINDKGEPLNLTGAPTFGISWSDGPLNPFTIKSGDGRAPLSPGEIVIDSITAKNNNFNVGDKARLQASGPVEDFTVVGLATFGEGASLGGATFVGFEFREAQRVFGLEGKVSSVSVDGSSDISAEELKQRIDQVLPAGAESVTGEQQRSEDLDSINQGLGFITTALLAFAGVSIFVGAFIIQNTFRIIIAQRSKELALLRAIGATRRQIRWLVVDEAFIVGIFASLLGIVVGIGIAYGLRAIANAFGLGLPTGPLTIEGRTIYVSFFVGTIVTVLSALLPAIRASRVSPVEAMRDVEAAAGHRSLKKRTAVGLLITAVGSATLLFGLFGSVKSPINYVGFGAAVMFFGISIVAPMLSSPVANLVGLPLGLYYRLMGKIARQNARRSPRRTASTAAALMIGVSLVVFASTFASSIKATVDDVIAKNFPGDITISSKAIQTNPLGATYPRSITDEITKLDEIKLVSRTRYDVAKINGSEDIIISIQPETFNEAVNIGPSDNSYDKLGVNDVYVYDDKLADLGLNIGDQLPVEFAQTGENLLTITGSFYDPYDSPYLISEATYEQNFSNRKDTFSVANVANDTTIDEAKAAIETILERYPTVQAQDKNELVNQARTQIDQLLAMMSALLGFAVIIAILGITNTLTLSVTERTREIGLLRAIGMTRIQVRKMIRAESIIIAVFGALLGMAMGIFFGWALSRALEGIGFSAFSVPVLQLVLYMGVAVLAGIIAAIVPSYKASRMNILKAINYE